MIAFGAGIERFRFLKAYYEIHDSHPSKLLLCNFVKCIFDMVVLSCSNTFRFSFLVYAWKIVESPVPSQVMYSIHSMKKVRIEEQLLAYATKIISVPRTIISFIAIKERSRNHLSSPAMMRTPKKVIKVE